MGAVEFVLYFAAAFLVGYTFVVVVRYALYWRVVRAQGKRVSTIPLHVWLVALSYDLLVFGMAYQIQRDLEPWHVFVYLPALLTGVVGMHVLGRRQQRAVTTGDPT